ncbi:DNA-binding XRE family transcriptional regulator [Salsuginibacillus halophilus]|uniref:DNA-binding XRE family transcriptional regulator n=1 Tax=Salsuginibacillus halophilus TaxID=517424 RepID=A0A2P8H8C1_9BACI|nr:helix-turn-helix domain-containing protein [Salsuginibacillus halophilus]PSL42430.1 DNA-binding XRE family transcriptional regulator [Salsuginibacillus halophilus]
MDQAKTALGAEVRRLREKRRLTQQSLATINLSQAALSKIEKGIYTPNLETLQYLAGALNVTIDHFLNILQFDNPEYVETTVNYIEELMADHQYEALVRLTKQELQSRSRKMDESWYTLFLERAYWHAAYFLGKKKADECIDHLKDLAYKSSVTAERFEGLNSKVLSSIAILLAEEQKFEESLSYFEKSLEEIPQDTLKHPGRDLRIYQIRILYNQVNVLYDLGNHEAALARVNEGLRLSKKYESAALAGQLYYYRGQCLEHTKGTFKEIKSCYEKALLFFEFLDKKMYIERVKNLKSEYINTCE